MIYITLAGFRWRLYSEQEVVSRRAANAAHQPSMSRVAYRTLDKLTIAVVTGTANDEKT